MMTKPLSPLEDPPSNKDDEVETSSVDEAEDSSSEEEDSDSEPPKNPSTGSGKAIADTNAKKKEPQSSSATLTKRTSEGTSKANGAAKNDTTSGQDTKKPAAWSEDDELALLNGMIDFKNLQGKSSYEACNEFYESVKKSISFPVAKSQLTDKRWNLKNKYNGKRKSGKQVSFTKPHDFKCFELSKSIWGVNGEDLLSSVANGKSVEGGGNKVVVHGGGEADKFDWFDSSFLVQAIAGNGSDERTVKQGWRSAPVEAKKKIEEEMKAFRAKEFQFAIVKTQLLNEAFSMLAEVMEQRGDI